MKNKIIIITAMLTVMVAMTGIAGAYGAIINPTFYIGGGNVDESGFTLSGVIGLNNFAVETEKSTVSVMICTQAVFTDCSETLTSTSTGWVNGGSYASNPQLNIDNPSGNPNLKVYTKGTETGWVYVHINQGNTYVPDGLGSRGFGHAETSAPASVPEFPTVALPVAAVIGLVFFFQQRKNKKE
jgi:hypothetical protein